MKILSVVGARPQFIKAAAVSRALAKQPGVREILVHTGQHYDENMSGIFFKELDIPEPDYNLEVGSGSHAWQTGNMLKALEEVMIREKPDWTLVYGDTNSTLAGALSAVKLHIPVAHVEAGLRSFNRLMPEEINRIATDRISDLLFAPTLTAMGHLEKEGLGPISCFTGDVMYDSILYYRDKIQKTGAGAAWRDIAPPFFLATIHRAENTDDPARLKNIFRAFAGIKSRIVLPLHPRTRNLLSVIQPVPENVTITEPAGYLDMIRLTLEAGKVLTDSGGLQKEAYFLGTPCITLRNETEWVETVHDGWNTITGTDPRKILLAASLPKPEKPRKDLFGKGNAATIIAERLK
ncbi:MAG TPA: UDP-N-acetylglucosamine 2-epimerase (non-hydrolyzing) [Bacteroidales bacterium]|nr:UDP-N-acetylglucosamine 2-epimerase (non-hydrolyzing) [Bacteroidales bacterium]